MAFKRSAVRSRLSPPGNEDLRQANPRFCSLGTLLWIQMWIQVNILHKRHSDTTLVEPKEWRFSIFRPSQALDLMGELLIRCEVYANSPWTTQLTLHIFQQQFRCRTEHLVLFPDDIQLCLQFRWQGAEAQITLLAGIHQMVERQDIPQPFPYQNAPIIGQINRSHNVQLVYRLPE